MTITNQAELVIVDYNDITVSSSNEVLLEKLDKAFGSEGTGLIGIQNVPGFVEIKQNVLSLAHPLAHLPESDLHKLEDPDSLYNAGWSYGKEKLKKDIPDTAKASFYFNPIADVPGTEEDRQKYPVSYPCNRWPTSSLPKLEPACKDLGKLMKEVAVHLAKHIDTYALSRNKNYQPETLYRTMVDTEKVKGRLLYYYPLPQLQEENNEQTSASEDSWIGWHNDSGFLTALAGDMFMTPNGDSVSKDDSDSKTKEAGLYVVDRNDNVRKVTIPKDCMAIQIGECTQIITGGVVNATPHCVKGAPDLARASLACFIDTPPSFPLNIPPGNNDSSSAISSSSSRVPPLQDRWTNGTTFGDFLQTTFQKYYEFANQ